MLWLVLVAYWLIILMGDSALMAGSIDGLPFANSLLLLFKPSHVTLPPSVAAAAVRAPSVDPEGPIVTKPPLPTIKTLWRHPDKRDQLAVLLFGSVLRSSPRLVPTDQSGKSNKGWTDLTNLVTDPNDGCLRGSVSRP
jgi:hypothetical protein